MDGGVKMYEFDVVIVGAGISGLHAARQLEDEFKVALVEESSSIGKYGNRVVNRDVFSKQLKKETGEEIIINSIDEFNFFSPGGKRVIIKEKNRGFIIDKGKAEEEMFKGLGSTFTLLNTKVIEIKGNELITNNNKIKFNFLVGADGTFSTIRRFVTNEKPIAVNAYYEVVEGEGLTSCVLAKDIADGFYGWSLDLNGETELGIGSLSGNVHERFKTFVNSFKTLYSSYVPRLRFRGIILRSVVDKKVKDNIALIGDASGGEPLMGSSIHKALDEAEILARAIRKGTLENYEKKWNEKLGKEFKMQEKIREKLEAIENEKLDELFEKNKNLYSEGLVNGLFKELLKEET